MVYINFETLRPIPAGNLKMCITLECNLEGRRRPPYNTIFVRMHACICVEIYGGWKRKREIKFKLIDELAGRSCNVYMRI